MPCAMSWENDKTHCAFLYPYKSVPAMTLFAKHLVLNNASSSCVFDCSAALPALSSHNSLISFAVLPHKSEILVSVHSDANTIAYMPAIRGAQRVSAHPSINNHGSFDPFIYRESLEGYSKMHARGVNNRNLRKVVKLVAPRCPTGPPFQTHNPSHRLVFPQLCFGITNPENVKNIGRWYQAVCKLGLCLTSC